MQRFIVRARLRDDGKADYWKGELKLGLQPLDRLNRQLEVNGVRGAEINRFILDLREKGEAEAKVERVVSWCFVR